MARRLSHLLDDPNAFDRMRARLGGRADTLAAAILAEEPDLAAAHLREAMTLDLGLSPLVVGQPEAIRIPLQPADETFGRALYEHQGTIAYSGSQQLWSAKPGSRTVSQAVGKAGSRTVTIQRWFREKRFDAFEQEVVARAAEFAAAVPLHIPAIEAFNAELPDYAIAWMNGRSEDLVRWRRRGHQLRERARKRQEFAEDEAPIDPVEPQWKRYVTALRRNG